MARQIFALLVLKPLAWLLLGLETHGARRLPKDGPFVITPNHNSYIDTWLVFAALPLPLIRRLRIVGAADHFPTKGLAGWLLKSLFGLLPIDRNGGPHVLDQCVEALQSGHILILFPEGTRGDPDEFGDFKSGIARLADAVPNLPICPLYLHGTAKVLPRGSRLFVPLLCSAHFAPPFEKAEDKEAFLERLKSALLDLRALAPPLNWF